MTDVQRFIQQETATWQRLIPPMSEAHWQLAITGDDQYAKETEALGKLILEQYSQKEPYEQVSALLKAGVDDPLTERLLTTIRNEYLERQFAPEMLDSIAKLEAELNATLSTYRGTIDGKPVGDNEAVKILQDSEDQDLRRKAWEATKMVAGEVAPKLIQLIKLRNAAARSLGYEDYYHLRMDSQEIDINDLYSLWDHLAAASETTWITMKGHLDARLAAKFGIAISDLRPWHYEDAQFQKAPQDPEANLDAFYADKDIVDITNRTFRTMGQPIDDLVEQSSLFPQTNKYQSAFCTTIGHDGDIRVCCSIAPNERWMATNLHEFGHAAYEKYADRKTLPYLLQTAAHSITTEGVAIFMGNFAVDPEWMQAYAGAALGSLDHILARINNQKRLEDMIFTRYEQVMVRFERELYRDPDQDLNAVWWDLVEKYQGLTRPEGRDWPDWASKVHFAIAPCMYQNYLYGFMFITQLAHYLRENVTDGGPLAVPEVGAYLIEKVYKPGASMRWDALIEHATGEPLRSDYWVAHLTAGEHAALPA